MKTKSNLATNKLIRAIESLHRIISISHSHCKPSLLLTGLMFHYFYLRIFFFQLKTRKVCNFEKWLHIICLIMHPFLDRNICQDRPDFDSQTSPRYWTGILWPHTSVVVFVVFLRFTGTNLAIDSDWNFKHAACPSSPCPVNHISPS